jgi:type I restriction enzyme S subunit
MVLTSVKIADCVQSVETWNPLKAGSNDEFVYVDLSAVDQDLKTVAGSKTLACHDAPSRARQLVRTDDVLVSTVRPNLNGVALVDLAHDGATASTGFCVLRADPEKLDPRYLFQWVKSSNFVDDMVRKATGASYPAVSDRIIFDSRLPLPSLSEQRRIAAILDQADALRAKRREALAQLDSLMQSVFMEMFGEYRHGRIRWPIEMFEQLTTDTQIGLVRGAEDFGPDFETPYVRMNALGRRGEFFPCLVQRTDATTQELTDYSLRAGDLLFNTRNSKELVGKTALFREQGVYVYNNNLMRIRFKPSIEPEYIAAAFLTPFIQQELETRKSGTTSVFAIYGRELKTLPIPVPPLPLQKTFATRIHAVEALKSQHRDALTELDALFASLQHRAFQGEL